jgi:alanine-glyoxylate transaminase / (R)-3-amino-2-methylpropionate-pyruvate transaminase
MNPTTATLPTTHNVLGMHREHLFPCITPYYEQPVVMEEGEGVWVRDAEGKEYLDFFAGILTTSIGHCHPRIVEALREQVGRLGHTSTLYVTREQAEAARKLALIAPGDLRRTFFTNSGTEAIENAITAACVHTGRSEIIALRGAYHGRSFMAGTLTAQSSWRPLPSRVAGISHTLAPYPYRCPFHRPCDERCSDALARDLEEAILTTTAGKPAAFIAETIQGVAGYPVPPAGYFKKAAEVIRSYGGLFISDEVQAGFGRTGGKWFGIEHFGVTPDIMVMAKGIAGGLPVGATITTDEIAASWKGKTISTFGGNALSMTAMSTTLDVMREEDVPTRAAERGKQVRVALVELEKRHAWIGEVRGMGLMQAIEIVTDRESQTPDATRARAVLEAAKAEGLLIGLGGTNGQVIRMGPSLLITEGETAEAMERLARACARVDS